jgi:hypothetical protein
MVKPPGVPGDFEFVTSRGEVIKRKADGGDFVDDAD